MQVVANFFLYLQILLNPRFFVAVIELRLYITDPHTIIIIISNTLLEFSIYKKKYYRIG